MAIRYQWHSYLEEKLGECVGHVAFEVYNGTERMENKISINRIIDLNQ